MARKSLPADNTTTRHLRYGWSLLAAFGLLGLVLETLHGFKLQAYVGVVNETRQTMWTLAHAHGTLFALIHIAFAVSLPSLSALTGRRKKLVSSSLLLSSLIMPLGFFLGGLQFYEGDPGLGILLVPLGALSLIGAAVMVAYHCR